MEYKAHSTSEARFLIDFSESAFLYFHLLFTCVRFYLFMKFVASIVFNSALASCRFIW
jgi:glucan phosphoethanolaminetransferase (alkaline phosphatase superfamily)